MLIARCRSGKRFQPNSSLPRSDEQIDCSMRLAAYCANNLELGHSSLRASRSGNRRSQAMEHVELSVRLIHIISLDFIILMV